MRFLCLVLLFVFFSCVSSEKKDLSSKALSSSTPDSTYSKEGSLEKGASDSLSEKEKKEILKIMKALLFAISSDDYNKTKEILSSIQLPKHANKRNSSLNFMINSGLIIALKEGLDCNPEMIELLEKEYEGRIEEMNSANGVPIKYHDEMFLCQNVIARSLAKMEDPEDAVLTVKNSYAKLIESSVYQLDFKLFERKVKAYNQLLIESSKMIKESCKKATFEPLCSMKNYFVDIADQTKDLKVLSIDKNAEDILRILQ